MSVAGFSIPLYQWNGAGQSHGLQKDTNHPTGILAINFPQLHASPTLQPELKDQELVVYQSTDNSYWEGAARIQDQVQGHTVGGKGYVKLTGYAHT